MKIILDQIARRKLLAVKNEKRVFVLEFPVDADIAELFGVVSEFKDELWEAMKREEEEKQKPKEDNIIELPIDNENEEMEDDETEIDTEDDDS